VEAGRLLGLHREDALSHERELLARREAVVRLLREVDESWSRRPETRIMKNSSRLLSEMQRNLRRSRSGHLSSRASSRTLSLKASQESSRFRSGVRGASAPSSSSGAGGGSSSGAGACGSSAAGSSMR
jgi:uncharacterized membrane protein YgcG